MLLIDYLTEASEYIRERREKMMLLDSQYTHTFDRSAKQEMALLKREIRKKRGEVTEELLVNLEEFHYIRVYFPELLQVLMEDPNVGKTVSKKLWLLDFKPLEPQDAAGRLQQVRQWRMELKEAKKMLKGWVGNVDARAFSATFPILRGHMSGNMRKDEVLEAIKKADRLLLHEGWLLLINDSLIQVPVAKFMDRITKLRYEETKAAAELRRSKDLSRAMELSAARKLEAIVKEKDHYERVLRQLLLCNPAYLRSLKKKTDWLARDRKTALMKFAGEVVSHRVKERAWLDEMHKKLG